MKKIEIIKSSREYTEEANILVYIIVKPVMKINMVLLFQKRQEQR